MEPSKVTKLFHNGYLVTIHENISKAVEHIDIILSILSKNKSKKVLELAFDNKLFLIYELKNKRKELFCIEND